MRNAGAWELAEELGKSDVFVPNSAELKYTTAVGNLDACDHMLLLLDKRTWTWTSGEDTAQLVEHIHLAMRKGVHILCAHEFPSMVGPPRNECEFGHMVSLAEGRAKHPAASLVC
jgi:hypothetical protein